MVDQPVFRGARWQTGSALFVALILLLVLTMLGVQGMRSNVMQERMAGNMRERNIAFQAAEAALRLGESQNPFVAFSPGNVALANPAEWDGVAGGGTFFGDFPNFNLGVVDADPAFHIGPPQYVRVGIAVPPEWRYIYPVTAVGFGGQDSSVVVVQSSFEPVN